MKRQHMTRAVVAILSVAGVINLATFVSHAWMHGLSREGLVHLALGVLFTGLAVTALRRAARSL